MQKINSNFIITNILTAMSADLNDDQMCKLKNTLNINFADVEITKHTYELVESVQGSDLAKIQYFEASMRLKKLSEKSIKQYVDSAMKLRNYWCKNLEDITTMEIEAYLSKKQQENNWKDTTLQNNICYLRTFYTFLKKKKFIDDNPMDYIDGVKLEKHEKEVFSVIDIEKIKKAAGDSKRDLALIELLYSSGIRVNELVQLKWKDMDFDHMSFVVFGKGAKEREVLFSEKCRFYLLEYLEERIKIEGRTRDEIMERSVIASSKHNPETKDFEGLKTNAVRKNLERLAAKAGVHCKFNPHKFRRTFATDAINRGMPLETLRKLMGHENYETTLLYAKVNDESVNAAYRKTVR